MQTVPIPSMFLFNIHAFLHSIISFSPLFDLVMFIPITAQFKRMSDDLNGRSILDLLQFFLRVKIHILQYFIVIFRNLHDRLSSKVALTEIKYNAWWYLVSKKYSNIFYSKNYFQFVYSILSKLDHWYTHVRILYFVHYIFSYFETKDVGLWRGGGGEYLRQNVM